MRFNVYGLVVLTVKLIPFVTLGVSSALEMLQPLQPHQETGTISPTETTQEKREMLYSSLRHLLRSAPTPGLRSLILSSNMTPPWSCDCDEFWRDLGDGFFPRFIKDGRCGNRTCWFGHYQCRPIKYELQVLKHLDDGDDLENFPTVIDNSFGVIVTEVTTGCQCVKGT